MPLRRGSEVAERVITRPGRYRKIADRLDVKEVTVGDGERRRRYVVCHNPEEERRQRKHRAQVLTELEAELEVLGDLDNSSYTKRVFELVASRRYGRYLRRTATGKLWLDPATVRRAEKHDGKFVVHRNDDTLTAEDMALGYKQLMQVEQAWRQLKSGLRLRPVFHGLPTGDRTPARGTQPPEISRHSESTDPSRPRLTTYHPAPPRHPGLSARRRSAFDGFT
jgi:hypothetical protein